MIFDRRAIEAHVLVLKLEHLGKLVEDQNAEILRLRIGAAEDALTIAQLELRLAHATRFATTSLRPGPTGEGGSKV